MKSLLWSVAACAIATPAWGQVASSDEAVVGAAADVSQAEAAQPGGGLEDIVVTAQRRGENLQKVPISITALTSQSLESAQVNDTQALASLTPGLQMNSQRSAVVPFLRGIGTANANPGDEGATAIYVDGILSAVPSGNSFSFNDIDRIEVLKGPQGTLFGRNAVGGLINIVTADPSDELTGRIELGYGNYDTITGSGYIAGGITPGVTASVAVSGSHQGNGWGYNPTLGKDIGRNREIGARAKLVGEVGEGTKLTLAADFNRSKGDIGSVRQALPGSVITGGYRFSGSIYDAYGEYSSGASKMQYGASLKVEQDLGDFTLQSTTAYRHFDIDSTLDSDGYPVKTTQIRTRELTRTLQQELLLTGRAGPLDLTAGLFYFHSNAGYAPFTLSGSAPALNYIIRDKMITSSYAGFAQATLQATDTTRLTAGMRYTHDDRQISGTQISLPGHPSGAGVLLRSTATLPKDQVDRGFGKLTWRLAVDQQVTPDVLLFVSASRGFKSGVFGLTAPFDPAVEPEVLDAYEAGIKADLFDRTLRLNISGFHYDYKNIQLTVLSSSNTPMLVNAASSKVNGIDGELVWVAPIEVGHLSFRASASYLDSKYKDYPNALIYIPIATGGNRTGRIDASGNYSSQAPKFTSSLGFSYEIPVGDDRSVSFDTNWYHNDGFFWDYANRLRQPAYDIVNAQLSLSKADSWRVRLWVKNLTNEKYYSFISSGTFGDTGAAAAPRTYGASLQFEF